MGTRGFSDPDVPRGANGTPIFDQHGYQPGSSGFMQPFHLLNKPLSENGEDTNDIAHDWVTQHHSWNGGKLDLFMTARLAADGIVGPVGLGFRTPALVISPFSAGGYRYSGTLDHTSTLRLIETRFGVPVPNLSAWRRSVTGDFTSALNLTSAPVTAVPALPSNLHRLEPHGRRGSRPERPHRHPGRQPPLPAPHKQLDARPGNDPRSAPCPVRAAARTEAPDGCPDI